MHRSGRFDAFELKTTKMFQIPQNQTCMRRIKVMKTQNWFHWLKNQFAARVLRRALAVTVMARPVGTATKTLSPILRQWPICIMFAVAPILVMTQSAVAGTPINCGSLAQEAFEQVATAVISLGSPGGLEGTLKAVQEAVSRGDAEAARGALRAFQSQVRALVKSGKLAAEDGEMLLSLAEQAMTTMTFCTPPVIAFSCRSSAAQNVLFWLNPSEAYASTKILYRTDQFPIGPADPSATLLGNFSGTPGATGSATHTGLINGTTYYYAAYVDDGTGAFSLRKSIRGRPDDNPAIFWSYNMGGTYAPIPGNMYSYAMLASDGVLHVITGGQNGGFWPTNWKPPQLPIAAPLRPLVLPPGVTTINGASRLVFVPTLEGRLYAINGDTGELLWTSPILGPELQANPCGTFIAFGGFDILTLGTYDLTGDNKFYGLNVADGSVAWVFDNGGGANAIGPIRGMCATIPGRVYFASRRKAGGSQETVWALNYTATSATKAWATDIGDAEVSITTRGNAIYAGNNAGEVYALNSATGEPLWATPYLTGDGPIKGYVFPDRSTPRLAFSTNTKVHLIEDLGSSFSLSWNPPVLLSNPAVLLLLSGDFRVMVADSPGRVYELDARVPAPLTNNFVTLGDPATSKQPGALSLDLSQNMLLSGTDDGVLYAVKFPFDSGVNSGVLARASAMYTDGELATACCEAAYGSGAWQTEMARVNGNTTEALGDYLLSQNHPNPFNPSTDIHFQLPQASQVVLKIFNTFGEEIRTLVDGPYSAGFHSLRWDGKDRNGNQVASGMYFYQLRAGGFTQMRKMILLR
jgi:outer membrane protein assembly factor BamB